MLHFLLKGETNCFNANKTFVKEVTDSEELYPPMFEVETKDDQWLGVIVRSQGPGRKVVVSQTKISTAQTA